MKWLSLWENIWAMKLVVLQVRSRKDNVMQIVNFPQNDRPDLSRRHSSSSIRNKRDVITDTNNSNDWIYLFFWRFYKNTSITFVSQSCSDLMKLEVMYFQISAIEKRYYITKTKENNDFWKLRYYEEPLKLRRCRRKSFDDLQ